MMDDAELVRQLRAHEEQISVAGGSWWETPEVCMDAADRIEALIAENARLVKDYDVAKAFHDLAVSERNRARELNVMLETRAEKAEAERDAARDAALEEAAKVAEIRHTAWQALGDACLVDDDISACSDIAAAIRALKGKSHE